MGHRQDLENIEDVYDRCWDDDNNEAYSDDSETAPGCVLGDECVNPHPYHTSDECASAEDMERWTMGDPNPCPYCDTQQTPQTVKRGERYQVRCLDCGGSGPWRGSRQEAVAAWDPVADRGPRCSACAERLERVRVVEVEGCGFCPAFRALHPLHCKLDRQIPEQPYSTRPPWCPLPVTLVPKPPESPPK